jgi:(p)ppGpp synthase/HD superfamily hydrolase
MSTLEHAIVIAAKAHEGQTDKGGAPYILHPLRIMLSMSTAAERITAILHDVVEDGGWTFNDLRADGFSSEIVDAVESVTRRPDETYDDYIFRAAQNPIGRRVKLADLKDNGNLSRIKNPTELDYTRFKNYHKAIEAIAKYMRDNNI